MMNLEYIYSDIYRYYGKVDFVSAMKSIKSKTIRFQIIFRLCNMSGIFRVMGKILYFFNLEKRRIQIPIDTKIGYGLYIGHGGPVVISSKTTIGDNCNLSQFVSIGTNTSNGAVIGNNVYIGPNVCLVGGKCK